MMVKRTFRILGIDELFLKYNTEKDAIENMNISKKP
jgi:anti-anti-sigma regulatory factor